MAIIQTSQREARVPITVFHLQDRINLGNATEMENAAKEAYANGVRHLVIDMTLTPSITSAGIRSLVVIFKMFADGDTKNVKLAGLSESIHEVLQISGVTQYVEVFDTIEEASASF